MSHSGMPGGTVWRISFTVPDTLTEPFELALGRFAGAVSSSAGPGAERWVVEGFSDAEPDRQSIKTAIAALAREVDLESPRVRFDLEPTVDWLTHNLEAFPPVSWARYWVAGTHLKDTPPPGKMALRIDTGTAFGSGEHPTTGGCLLLIDRLARRRPSIRRVLDLGCGSGILGIAAAKTWNARVIAADIDPESVRVTRRHAWINRIGRRIDAGVADGYRRRHVANAAPYDLIVANILARPLAKLSAGLGRNLTPNGTAIISGLLTRDGPWMTACHRYAGLHIVDKEEIDGWLSLRLERRAGGARAALRTRPAR